MRKNQRSRRFVLGGALLVALAASAVPTFDAHAGLSRDAQRLRGLQHIDEALRAYQADTGELPGHLPDAFAGGWETSLDGHFLEQLVVSGHLAQRVLDPLNDGEHHLLYHRYPAGTEGASEPFYVLAATSLETETQPPVLRAQKGARDWGAEYPLAILGP